MPNINLLPWREELREDRKKIFNITFGLTIGGGLLLMIFIHWIISEKINLQQDRNRYLTQEIHLLDQKIMAIRSLQKQRSNLLERMVIIEKLQNDRARIVHIFAEIVNILPEGIYLKKISRQENTITFEGIAESNTNISNLMRNIDNSSWLARSALNEIKLDTVSGKNENQFKLHLSSLKPNHYFWGSDEN